MFTEAYLEPSRTSTMELVLLRLSHILKTYLIRSIELPLGSIFYATHPFVKKLTTVKISGEKALLKMEQFFFEIRNYAMEWRHHKNMIKCLKI